LGAIAAIACTPALAQADEPPLVLGANTEGIDQAGVGLALDSFQQRTGVMPKIVMYFRDWNQAWSTAMVDPKVTQPISDRGGVPMITWQPMNSAADPVHQPQYSPAQVASGAYDDYIRRAADEAAAYDGPLFVRLAHEMNGNWLPWGAGVDGNTPADYVAMWRHVVSIFREEGATQVKWVWSPSVFGGSTGVADFTPYYPGDDWVDYVGLDGYNWGSTLTGQSWQSFFQVFSHSYDALAALTGRPMMIAETSSAEQGGDKAAWINAIADELSNFPRLRALIWFDRNKETDWRVDSSIASGAAFRSLAASPLLSATVADLLAAPTVAPTPLPPADEDPVAPEPRASIVKTPAREGDSGTHSRGVFAIHLSNQAERRVTVRYQVGLRRPSHAGRKDISRRSGRVTILPGHSSGRITIRVKGDRRPERNEKLRVRLFDSENATLDQRSAVGSIVDDD
jgi:beta-mannanase